jgi:hypothetical protein
MLRTLALIALLAGCLACSGNSKKQQDYGERSSNAGNTADVKSNTPDTRTTGNQNGTGGQDTSSNQSSVPQPGPATTPTPQASSNATTTQPTRPKKK